MRADYHLWSQIQLDNADIPQVDFQKTKNINKSRKPHVCRLCKKVIPIGNKCLKITTCERREGVYSTYEHDDCRCWK